MEVQSGSSRLVRGKQSHSDDLVNTIYRKHDGIRRHLGRSRTRHNPPFSHTSQQHDLREPNTPHLGEILQAARQHVPIVETKNKYPSDFSFAGLHTKSSVATIRVFYASRWRPTHPSPCVDDSPISIDLATTP